jgi:hypothetical protein
MVAAMGVPFGLATFWVLRKNLGPPGGDYPGGIEPIYVGLAASLAIFLCGWAAARLRRPPLRSPASGLGTPATPGDPS